ncbi:hypothetical protein U5817_09935 [Aromatoleum evansii]|uniref:Uncharacterized protein n=1 Tax=Aromatoleum evansii TaxID=59406 RepID=A0ABZ1AR58_AROEV|nr:hypothetical protein U5817_09585 [Aromatoleum evansii]WRL48346.1 hypothetical protein U5817_09935 [Aromatoleum evansii]
MDTNRRIIEAEKQIAAILAKLESETGMIVERLSVENIETTGIDDVRRQLSRRVEIEMMMQPGSNWIA